MAKGQRFQRQPESREPSIWDVFQGEYPALTSWAAPTYQYWYPYPFGDPYAKTPGLSPLEKLQNPNAQMPQASPQVPSFAPAVEGGGGVDFGGGDMGAPLVNPGQAALGLLAGAGAGAGVEAGVEGLKSLFTTPPATTPQGLMVEGPAVTGSGGTGRGTAPSPVPFLGQVSATGAPPVTVPQSSIVEGANFTDAPFVSSARGIAPSPTGATPSGAPIIPAGGAASTAAPAVGAAAEGARLGTTGTEFLNAVPTTGEKTAEILNSLGGSALQTGLGAYSLGTGIESGNPGAITSGAASTAAGTAALTGAIPASAATTIGAAFAFPALMAALDESDWFGLGGKSDMLRRQQREEELRQHAQADVASGLGDALTPGQGLDIPGIDTEREQLSTLPTETLLASLARANALRGSANASFGRAGDLPGGVDQMNANVFRRQIDLYDELQRRGVNVAPDVTGWGPDTPGSFPVNPEYSAQDWTLAQFLAMMADPNMGDPAAALGYADIKPESGPLGPWFDLAVQGLKGGDVRRRRVRPEEEPPQSFDPAMQVGF